MPMATLGPYQVLGPIGMGGMGEVLLAYDPRLERQVALKRLRREASSEAQARFRREAKVAAQLGHPALVQVHDLLAAENDEYIVMEYVPGQSLRQRLEEQPLPFREGLQIATQIAEGLAYAHQHGVVHRDLKTENVLLNPEGQAKIADFGVARQLLSAAKRSDDTLTSEGILLGTVRAMSPEQINGESVDGRSDLFSFGILLYEMFTGQSPFLADDSFETLRRILQEPHRPARELNSEVPAGLSALIDYLLEKAAALRPRDASEVAEVLRGLADAADKEGEVTVFVEVPPKPAPIAPGARGLWRWLIGVVVLSAVGAVWLLIQALRTPPSPPAQPIYVAVLQPIIKMGAGDPANEFWAYAVRDALESHLWEFEQVYVKSLQEVDEVESSKPNEIARAVGADEFIETTLQCNQTCSVKLRRIRVEDLAIVWMGDDLDLWSNDDPPAVNRAVLVRLRDAYPGREPPKSTELKVRPEVFQEFLEIQQLLDRRSVEPEELKERVTKFLGSAKNFPDAYVLAAEISFGLWHVQREEKYLDEALDLIKKAQDLDPDDPKIFFEKAHIEIGSGRTEDAEATLERLDDLKPEAIQLFELRARLAERAGRPDEALERYRKLVLEAKPSWKLFYNYANMAFKYGNYEVAEGALEDLFKLDPQNRSGTQLQATIKLVLGDPRAADLFAGLAAGSRDPLTLSNLGLARMLGGDYGAAAEVLQKVAAGVPNNAFHLLNLADALELQGRKEEAREYYERVLALLASNSRGVQERIVRAQALAHLKRNAEAIQEVEQAVSSNSDSGEVQFGAAIVYALTGDPTKATAHARRAVDLRFGKGWFRLPWFDHLQNDPAFQAVVSE